MEKDQKAKSIFLNTLKKISSDQKQKIKKLKTTLQTTSTTKFNSGSSLLSVKKTAARKKIIDKTKPSNTKLISKPSTKVPRNNSLEGNYGDQNSEEKSNKRNNSLVDLIIREDQ